MARNVLMVEPGEDMAPILVKMSEASARIEARRVYEWHRKRGFTKTLSDDEILEELMVCHWAWFDEE